MSDQPAYPPAAHTAPPGRIGLPALLDAVDAILAEIERIGYGLGSGPSQTPVRDLARQARALLKEAA